MPPYWPKAGDGRAVEVGQVEARAGRHGRAVVEARALALVEVERRPAGDGRAAWSLYTPTPEICGRVRVAHPTVYRRRALES